MHLPEAWAVVASQISPSAPLTQRQALLRLPPSSLLSHPPSQAIYQVLIALIYLAYFCSSSHCFAYTSFNRRVPPPLRASILSSFPLPSTVEWRLHHHHRPEELNQQHPFVSGRVPLLFDHALFSIDID